jgi:hypothetical protein
MRGAVLHGLGLNLVRERLMRRNYGVQLSETFDPKVHPERLRFRDDVTGVYRCDVMHWYSCKVSQPKDDPY